jgi:hypothetical protein
VRQHVRHATEANPGHGLRTADPQPPVVCERRLSVYRSGSDPTSGRIGEAHREWVFL